MARRPIAWFPLMMAMLSGAALAGAIGWRVSLQALEGQIHTKQDALKKLVLSGRIPPNEEVMGYITSRQASVERRYRRWVEAVAAPPLADAAAADPQVYFQERYHEIQRMLERLAAARTTEVPQLLGFPKELPPSDTVPRLLVQLALIQETAELMFGQGVALLASLKIQDPVMVPEDQGTSTFLMRLPVEVRFVSTLPQLMKILGALQLAQPIIDVRTLRVNQGAAPETLDVQLVCSRYLVMAAAPEQVPAQDTKAGAKKKKKGARAPAQRQTATKGSPQTSAGSE